MQKIVVDNFTRGWYYIRVRFGDKKHEAEPSNQNLKRKQRGMAELETGGQELRSACDTKQKNGERKRRKLSTGIGRDAWKQAKRKRKAKWTKGTREHR